MIIQVIGAFFAVVTFSIIFGVPKKYLPYSGFAGAFGWWIYLLVSRAGGGIILGMFAATLASALVSHLFARLLKAPVTVFLIPSILPTVPGVGMYRIVYYMIIGDSVQSQFYLSQTLQIAGVIAIGIFIIDTLFRTFRKKRS